VVRGREFDPSQSCRRGSGKKGDPEEPEDHALGRSRGGFGSKLHLVCDSGGLPLAVEVTAGQAHESKSFADVMNAVRIPQELGRPRQRPQRLAGDKGYSYPWIRRWLRAHKIEAIIPQRSDQIEQHKGRPLSFDRETYRRRNVIERCVGWLKEFRRLATRYEKLALNFLAMVKLAMIERYLRIGLADSA
jgi:transposase